MEEAYAAVRWDIPSDFLSREHYERTLLRLDLQASPGYPYLREAATIGLWLGVTLEGQFAPDQVERLWQHILLILSGEFDHYYRVFVKDEVHRKKKADEGRWRLILASALPMQVLWHMLFAPMNDLEAEKIFHTPSAFGVSFVYGEWKMFKNYCKVKRLEVAIDKSGWDWNAPGWVFDADLQLRYRLCNQAERPAGHLWFALARKLYDDAFEHSRCLLPSGQVYVQEFSGFMKSGIVNTISTNSHAQIMLHMLACKRSGEPVTPILACGDDTIQAATSAGYIEELARAGCIVKSVDRKLEFMGFNFEGAMQPIYTMKHIASFTYKSEELHGEILDSMCRMYAHHPWFDCWKMLAGSLGHNMKSRAWYQFFLDSTANIRITKSI
ncbi:RNA-dependent RNA polymerase [Laem Singh virus]|nr:RNA-dependent RNA polymerase [Laem Singh virus]